MSSFFLFVFFFFFFNDTATTEIYTLSLHDALPPLLRGRRRPHRCLPRCRVGLAPAAQACARRDARSAARGYRGRGHGCAPRARPRCDAGGVTRRPTSAEPRPHGP